jgi:hypothetical protein
LNNIQQEPTTTIISNLFVALVARLHLYFKVPVLQLLV